MRVKDFVYNLEKKKEDDVAKFVEKHLKTHYISYSRKMSEAELIVKHSSTVEVDGKETFRVSSPMRWMLFVLAVLRNYTTLELNAENLVEDFDALDKSGAIETLFAVIGKDIDTFNTVLNMVHDDYLTNERDVVSYIEHKLEAVSKLIDEIDLTAIEEAAKAVQNS